MLIVIDEADKLFEPSIGSAGVDYSRKIQNEFLKIMDGDKVDFVSEGNDAKKTTIDCSHVSFVFCGSFETLLQNREDKPATIGFFQNTAPDEEADEVSTPIQKGEKIGRNDPCPCGSGKKYKNCCGKDA